MILSTSATEGAFQSLIKALDEEVKKLGEVGQTAAFRGSVGAQNASRVLGLAGERAKLRDHVAYLHQLWKQDMPLGIKRLPVIDRRHPANKPIKNPPLAKNVAGLSMPEAAQLLGVDREKLLSWIEAGVIHAHRQGGGRWKIARAELARFCRERHDLLGRTVG